MTIADVYTVEVEADTEDEAGELAKAESPEVLVYDEQRILHAERLLEEATP
jgi:hypothetical protein